MDQLNKPYEMNPFARIVLEGSIYSALTGYFHLSLVQQILAVLIISVSFELLRRGKKKIQETLAARKRKKELAEKERLFKWLEEYNNGKN